MTKTNEIKIGSVVKHAYRKTLTFVVTETTRTGKFHIQRAKKINGVWTPQSQYKGYALANRDFANGLITVVDDKSNVIPSLSEEPAVKTISVAELEKDVRYGVLSINIVNEFKSLEARLSPENLTCDGEAGPAYVKREMAEIKRTWALLEQIVGRSVECSL